MKIEAEYAYYKDKNNYFYLYKKDDFFKYGDILENLIIEIDNGILDVRAKKVSYETFGSLWDDFWWWDDSMLETYDLEDRSIDDITELRYKNLLDFIVLKKSRYIKSGISLRRKEEKNFFIKTSNWTIKWV